MNVIEVEKIKEAIDLLDKAIVNGNACSYRDENTKDIKRAKYILENLIEFKDFTLPRRDFK